jgi:hypothetical protein
MAIIKGTNGIDSLRATSSDSLFAYDGDDSIAVLGNRAFIDAGNGNDTISITGANNTLYAGNGNDRAYVTGNQNSLFGGNGYDYIQIVGDANKVLVTFQETDGDTLWVRGNFNQLSDTNGNGSATVFGNWNGYAGWGGNDSIAVYGEGNEVYGDKSAYYAPGPNLVGNDTIYAYGNQNKLVGGGGNDTLYARGNANRLYGDAGVDYISAVGNGNSVLNSGDVASADRINFSGANNYIQATTADAIYVSGVNNKIDIVGFTGAANGSLVAYQSQAGALTNTLTIQNNHQDIVFLRQGNNLVIGFDDQAGQLTVVNQFAGSGYGIAALKANDGFFLSAADLVNVTKALTAYDTAIASVTFNSVAAIKASAYAETLIDHAFHV